MPRLIVVALLCSIVSAAHAADEAATERIRPAAIPSRADALSIRVEAAGPDAARREAFDEIERQLAERGPKIEAISQQIASALQSDETPMNELADLQRELEAAVAPLGDWQQMLDAEALRAASQLDQLVLSEALWAETASRPETAKAGEAVERRAQASVEAIRDVKQTLLEWRKRVLALEARIAGRHDQAKAVVGQLDEAEQTKRDSLLVPGRAPIWRSGFAEDFREELPQVPATLRAFAEQNRAYVARDSRHLVAQLLLALLLVVAFRQVGEHVRRREGTSLELLPHMRVLNRPVSIGLLLALLATPWLHPVAPLRFRQLAAVLALFPVARIVTVASEGTSRGVLAGLFMLLLVDRLSISLTTLPAVSQAIFAANLALAVVLALRVMRRGGLPGDARRVRLAAAIAAVASAFALLAEAGGWVSLSTLIGRATISGALIAVYLWAAVEALDALLVGALRSRRLAGIVRGEDGGQLAEQRARRLVRWAAALVWLYVVLASVGLREPTADAVEALLTAGISIGALSLTIGGVLAFGLTVVVAPIVARSIDLVLQHGVFPRAQLPRGVPYALSTLARYAVYILAFLAALAAAGVQLSQLSILLGGLGVGVGLGLQDIVKNFAAGLTLLLERRLHVNDVVQIRGSEIYGRVLEIGMRAALVRNWDGAEVIVPNTDLVASAVTNWTLSDQLRRIEIPVGVAYGTDPERVVALLLEIAEAHADILAHPPPQALFQGFGESSLDFLLRAWSDSVYDRTFAIRSELALAIHRALAEAGITIPFPQRDLHLASVSPDARAALGQGEER